MRIQRVSDIPHGGLAYVSTTPGTAPVVYVDASLTEAQVTTLIRRLSSDPEIAAAFGIASV